MPQDVVIDTNLFVAAGFNPRSAAAHILRDVASGRLCMIWNRQTRGEVEAVINKIPPLSGRDAESLFRREGFFGGKTHPEHFEHVPDPTDRKFIALAEAADAVLISNDSDLLEGRERTRVTILKPAEFCDRFLERKGEAD
jgi:predicted nucleic acid-binding protein